MSNSNKKRSINEVEASSDDVVQFTFKSRKNEFSARTWWMVDMEGCESNQGATALVTRCMRNYNWTLDQAKDILKAYRQFLSLKKKLEDWDATILSPSHLVDQMWHQHILDITNYCHDMTMMCGQIVSHNPDGALDQETKKLRDERTREELIKKFGSEDVDREVWGFPINPRTDASGTEPSDAERTSAGEPFTITAAIREQNYGEIFFKGLAEVMVFAFYSMLFDLWDEGGRS